MDIEKKSYSTQRKAADKQDQDSNNQGAAKRLARNARQGQKSRHMRRFAGQLPVEFSFDNTAGSAAGGRGI